MKVRHITLLSLLLLQTACATIMKQDWEEVNIETEPPGAVVTLNNGVTCHTPCNLELERGDNYSLTIEKKGFQTHSMKLDGSSWDGWIWGNLVFFVGLPIGLGIDFYTGYAYDFAPNPIHVKLKQ